MCNCQECQCRNSGYHPLDGLCIRCANELHSNNAFPKDQPYLSRRAIRHTAN
jgi:hypothetical protein